MISRFQKFRPASVVADFLFGFESLRNGDRLGSDALFALTDALAITDPVNRSPKPSKAEGAALGANIRCAREKLGLSQGQFAREIGMRQQKVSEWERGLRLRRIARARTR